MNLKTATRLFRNLRWSAPAGWRGVLLFTLVAACFAAWAAEPKPLSETELGQRLNEIRAARDDGAQLRSAQSLLASRAVSCAQVKAIAQTIANEDSRIEFALAAFPRTVDPENFYEVYDAFQTFSKVFRLHDRIAALRREPPPAPQGPAPGSMVVDEEAMAEILAAVRKEAFDDGKLTVGRQIVRSAKGRIASKQVFEVLRLFTFDDGRLELAKAAYDCVRDPWNYHVVYDTFTFSSNRESLARYVESHAKRGGPAPKR